MQRIHVWRLYRSGMDWLSLGAAIGRQHTERLQMSERASSYSGAVTVEFRGKSEQVEYAAFYGELEEWWFTNRELNKLPLTEREQEMIDEAVWEDAQL